MPDYLITVRNLRGGEFGSQPGPTRFLELPSRSLPKPEFAVPRKRWVDAVMAEAHDGTISHDGEHCGDIVVLVHGYNTSPDEVAKRHRRFRKDFAKLGFRGVVVSFDWPSDDRAINYLEDRSDAKKTALRLVDDCISLFAAMQTPACRINLHVAAHSMGCYVLREAFDDADDRPAIAANNWTVSQMCLFGADISSASLAESDARSRSLYRHCTRLTNYQNPYDSVLQLSDVKRAGVAPRAGRRGLPPGHPDKAVNVNCGEHFKRVYSKSHDSGHSWYFTDLAFLTDLLATVRGSVDRRVIAARRSDEFGALHLD